VPRKRDMGHQIHARDYMKHKFTYFRKRTRVRAQETLKSEFRSSDNTAYHKTFVFIIPVFVISSLICSLNKNYLEKTIDAM
jgi:hypothetical protein